MQRKAGLHILSSAQQRRHWHTACTQPLRESGFRAAALEARLWRCSRIIGSRYSCTHVRQPATTSSGRAPRRGDFTLTRVLRAGSTAFLGQRTMHQPQEQYRSDLPEHADPARQLMPASAFTIARLQTRRTRTQSTRDACQRLHFIYRYDARQPCNARTRVVSTNLRQHALNTETLQTHANSCCHRSQRASTTQAAASSARSRLST